MELLTGYVHGAEALIDYSNSRFARVPAKSQYVATEMDIVGVRSLESGKFTPVDGLHWIPFSYRNEVAFAPDLDPRRHPGRVR